MNIEALRQFLVDSNQAGYAGGDAKQWLKEPDGSTTIPYTQGEWRSHDNVFGGEPSGGRIVVFYQDAPVWMMVYYGWVAAGTAADPVYAILRKALMHMPDDAPFRGPQEFVDGEFTYRNRWTGNVERYTGEEQVTQGGSLIYQANYLGGLVDHRRGV